MFTDEQLIDDAPLTSPALQQSHPGVYRHLFERCSTVLSAPLAMSLTGDRSLSSREASIVIQLPRRVWVGIERTTEASASLGSFVQYDLLSERFINAQSHDRQAFERVLPTLQPLFPGTRIHILSETQSGRSLAHSGTLSALLSALASLQSGTVTAGELDGWRSSQLTALLGDSGYRYVVRRGRELQRLLRRGRTLGSSVLSALNPNRAQCAAFSGEDILTALSATDVGAASNAPSTWPVDIAVLSSGTRNDLGLGQEVTFEDAPLRAQLAELRMYVPRTAPLVAPLHGTADALTSDIRERAFLHVLAAWMELWSHGEREESVTRLLTAMQQREAFSTATEAMHAAIRMTLDSIRANLAHRRHAAFPLGTGSHGGTVMLVMARDEARTHVQQIVHDLRQHGLSDASVDYLSWRDDNVSGPLRIEQHLATQRMSTHLPPNALRFTRYGCDGTGTILRSRNDGIPQGLDVVVDTERERIYVASREVSSRELWSQRTTCEVLRRLLPSPEAMVASTELPRSSYRSSRSEMSSKVLTPFTKLVSVRTGKPCGFTTRGTIDAYTICADIRMLSIGVLEPCFSPVQP